MGAPYLRWHGHSVNQQMHAAQKAQRPCMIWFTGLSGAGKSTLANVLEKELLALNKHSYLLDGDNVRLGLNRDLGFSDADRTENIRRIGEVGRLMADAGLIVISAFISPFESDRQLVRALFPADQYFEFYVKAPLSVCEERDPKGLYQKARRGEIRQFTGIDSDYEVPSSPDLVIDTHQNSIAECTRAMLDFLNAAGIFSPPSSADNGSGSAAAGEGLSHG